MSGRILVGGGSGFIGKEVVRLFERLDYEVIVISRSNVRVKPRPLEGFREYNPVPKNIRTWDNIKEDGLPSGTVAIVNVAGQNILDPFKRWSDGFKKTVYDSRINTNNLLARAIEKRQVKPKALIHVSGVGYYPPGDEPIDESHEGGTHDYFAKLVHDWENAAQIHTVSNTRVVSLRSGIVLGRNGGLVQQTILPFVCGLGGRMGSGNQIMPWIHVKDLASLIAFCVHTETSGVINAVAPEKVTNREFVKAYANHLSRPALIPIPSVMLKSIFGDERASIITQSQNVVPKRAIELGFKFQYPTIAQAIEEFAYLMYEDMDMM